MLSIRFPYGRATLKPSVLQGKAFKMQSPRKIFMFYFLSRRSVLHLRIFDENITQESAFFLDEAVIWFRGLGNL
jgi:hypothetical protein